MANPPVNPAGRSGSSSWYDDNHENKEIKVEINLLIPVEEGPGQPPRLGPAIAPGQQRVGQLDRISSKGPACFTQDPLD